MLFVFASIAAISVTFYWSVVSIKAFLLYRNIGKGPNVVPKEKVGLVIRVFWFPVIVAWIALLWHGVWHPVKYSNFLQLFATLLVVIATALTCWCWREMGNSWRIGIDPVEKTTLIVTGPYRYVRHPIYSLSMLLATATWLVLPTLPLLVIVVLHIVFLNWEAHREEKYLTRTHGENYISYCKKTGRFIPCMGK